MSEKTEAPSAARLRRARAEGDIVSSAAVTRWATFTVGVLLLPSTLAVLAFTTLDLLKRALTQPVSAQSSLEQLIGPVAVVIAPWLGAMAAVALIVTLLQTKGFFSLAQLTPKVERLSPWRVVVRLADGHHWAALLTTLIGAVAMGGVGAYLLLQHLQSFAHTAARPEAAPSLVFAFLQRLFLGALAVGLCFAAIDWLILKLGWLHRLRMTRAEWLEDQRSAHGDPAIRSERSRRRSEASRQ